MWPFSKKEPIVEFFHASDIIGELYPITPINKSIPEWRYTAAKDLSEMRKCPTYGTEIKSSLIKCTGINKLFKYGWLLPLWTDIRIGTDISSGTWGWDIPEDYRRRDTYIIDPLVNNLSPILAPQSDNNYLNLSSVFPQVFKFTSHWRVSIPEDYYLYLTTPPYNNDNRWEVLPGLLDNDLGLVELNVQFIWKIKTGNEVIKAGTPFVHIIPIPKKEVNYKIRKFTEADLISMNKSRIIINSGFIRNYKQASKCIKEHLLKIKD